ncbi:MAG: DUF1616 domain-containing protein [Candidatus Moranbacteria bacterium]|nr:DUF1616 domain-containing protein [Candidatus Moranbacteria bacterium]
MLLFIQNQLLLYAAIAVILFLPGYLLLVAIWGKGKIFSELEKFIISVALSIGIVDVLLILLGKFKIPITRFSILLALAIFFLVCILIKYSYNTIRRPADSVTEKAEKKEEGASGLFSFSKNQVILVILIFFLSVFIRTVYLRDTITPSATDLGHHMYWTNLIVQKGVLPEYEKVDIIKTDEHYSISQPQKIADFIIGEHLVFAAIALISGANAISAFPPLVLLLINIIGIGAVFILVLRLFGEYPWGKNAAIFALFLLGPLYAISSSQAKFVSGGVIGNIIGNLLIPLAIYFFYRAVQEKRPTFFTLALFLTATLFYTHHLSALIFIFVLFLFLILFIILSITDRKALLDHFRIWRKLIFSPSVTIFLLFTLSFLLFVYTPSYIKINALETVVGAPSKSTKEGFSFSQISIISGEARMVLGIFGAFIIMLFLRKKPYPAALLASWIATIFIMSWKPQWLHINIPSIRIANYLSYPLAAAGAVALAWIFFQFREPALKKVYISSKLALSTFVVLFTFVTTNGFFDNAQSLKASGAQQTFQTFRAAQYLAEKTSQSDIILKDHYYIAADAWMKLFFMRDYNYPFTRSFFFRYEENKKREQCTFQMISSPNTDEGKKCFAETGTNFVVINPAFDSAQFQKSQQFDQVYSADEIAIFHRK